MPSIGNIWVSDWYLEEVRAQFEDPEIRRKIEQVEEYLRTSDKVDETGSRLRIRRLRAKRST